MAATQQERATRAAQRRAAEDDAIRAYAARLAAAMPPLTPEQRLRIRAILHGR
jgi:hypothetical protein